MAEKIININDYRAASRHKYAKKPDISRVDYMRKLREEAKENSFMQQMVNLFKTQTKALGKAKIGKQTVAQRANGFVHGAQMTTAALAKDLGFDKMFRKLQHKSKPALARGKQMMNNVRKNLTLDAKAANLDKAPGEIQKFNKGFAHGFAAFLKDPKASIRQASGHVQHAFAQVGQKIKNTPSFLVAAPAAYHKMLDKFDERKINMAMNSMTHSQARLDARRQNNIELGKVNKQGLSLEPNPKGGFYFVAHKDTKIPTGRSDGRGQQYMHLAKGQHTATIVPQGRKAMQALAHYSHGDKAITLGADSNSTIVLGKHLKNPDILNSKTAGNLSMRSSYLKLDKDAELGLGVDLDHSRAEVNGKTTGLHMKHSNGKFNGPVKDSDFENCYNVVNNGSMDSVNATASAIHNNTHMKDATIARSVVNTSAKNDFQQVDVQDAQLDNTTAVGNYLSKDPNKRTFIKHGHYIDSQVRASNLDIGTNSTVHNSSISGSYARNQDPLTSSLTMDGSNVENSTMALKHGQRQMYNGADLSSVLATGNQSLLNSSLRGSKKFPVFLRNAQLKNVLSNTQLTPIALTETTFDGKGKQLTDRNIPKMIQAQAHGAAYNLMRKITGYTTTGKPLSTIQTKRGKMAPIDQINTVSNNIVSPKEGFMLKALHLKDFVTQRALKGLKVEHEGRSKVPVQNQRQGSHRQVEAVGPEL